MATVIRVAAVISISIIAVSTAGSVRGSTCDTCECPLSNVEIINDIINARINAMITSRVEEFTASFEERMNVTLDEEIETINATLSAVDVTADERIMSTSAAVDAVNVKIVHATDKHLSQPGKTYINLQSHTMDSFYHDLTFICSKNNAAYHPIWQSTATY